jgi:hypothetical protein
MATVVNPTVIPASRPWDSSGSAAILESIRKSKITEAEKDKTRRLSEALTEIISTFEPHPSVTGPGEEPSTDHDPIGVPDRVRAATIIQRRVPDLDPQERLNVEKIIDSVYEAREGKAQEQAEIGLANQLGLGLTPSGGSRATSGETRRTVITQGSEDRRQRDRLAFEREKLNSPENKKEFDQKVASMMAELKPRFPDITRDRAVAVVDGMDAVGKRLNELYGRAIPGGLFEVTANNKIPYSIAIARARDKLAAGGNPGEAAVQAYKDANSVFQTGKIVDNETWKIGRKDAVSAYLQRIYNVDRGDADAIVDDWRKSGVFQRRVRDAGGTMQTQSATEAPRPSGRGAVAPSGDRPRQVDPVPLEKGQRRDLKSEREVWEKDVGLDTQVANKVLGLNKSVRDALLRALGVDPASIPFILPTDKTPKFRE